MLKELEEITTDKEDVTKDWEVKKGGLAIDPLDQEEENKKPTTHTDVVKEDVKEEEQTPLTHAGEEKQLDQAIEAEMPKELQAEATTTENPVNTPERVPSQDIFDNPESLNYDSFVEELGLNRDKMKEKVYTTEQQQKALGRQQNWSAIGEVFKLIMESAGASGGMYVDKREPNKFMEATYKRLQELKDKDLMDARRREANRVNNEIRNVGMFNQYRNNERNISAADSRAEVNRKFQSDEADKSRKYNTENREDTQEHQEVMQDKRISSNPQNDKEFIKWKAELEKDMRIEIAKETSSVKIAEIESRYNQMYEYQKKINEAGYSGDNIEINGKSYTKDQVYSEADKILATIDPKSIRSSHWLYKAIRDKKVLSYSEAQALIREYSQSGLDPDENLLDDTPESTKTDIYGNPI